MNVLSRLIEDSLRAVEKDPEHNLPLGYRHAILSNLSEDKEQGKKKQVKLGIMTAEKALPTWEKIIKEDIPQKALEAAKKASEGKISSNEADKLADRYWTDLDNFMYDHQELANRDGLGFYAGPAAVKALSRAANGGFEYPEEVDLSETDKDQDPYTTELEYYTCLALTGNGDKVDKAKRKEFWEWWLKEAIPEIIRTD